MKVGNKIHEIACFGVGFFFFFNQAGLGTKSWSSRKKNPTQAVDEEPPQARFGRPRNKADRFAGGSTSNPAKPTPGRFFSETRVGNHPKACSNPLPGALIRRISPETSSHRAEGLPRGLPQATKIGGSNPRG
jgi:hypothetical protein